MEDTVTVMVAGSDGTEHEYRIMLFDVDEGFELMFQLASLGGGALGALLQSGVGAFISADKPWSEFMDSDVSTLVAGVDFAEFGSQLAAQLGRSKESLALLKRLLRSTWRDGQDLRNPVHWAKIYRGNQTEALVAAFHVIRVNRLFPLPATS